MNQNPIQNWIHAGNLITCEYEFTPVVAELLLEIWSMLGITIFAFQKRACYVPCNHISDEVKGRNPSERAGEEGLCFKDVHFMEPFLLSTLPG